MATKIIHSSVTKDYESGELKHEERQYTRTSDEPDYVKLYVKAWCVFREIKGINMAFLTSIIPYMSYAKDGQVIFFNSTLKRRIGTSLGWSEKSILNRVNVELAKLQKANVIHAVDGKRSNTYQVNPELFGKGEWKDISKLVVSFHLHDGKIDIAEEEPTLFDYDLDYEKYQKALRKQIEKELKNG